MPTPLTQRCSGIEFYINVRSADQRRAPAKGVRKMRKGILSLAVAGSVAMLAAQASAFTGDLIKCSPNAGDSYYISFKKGLTCTESLNKVGFKNKVKDGNGFDNCVANANAPWDEWAAGKYSKVTDANAALIAQADLSLKGVSFGTCNLGGSTNSAGASGAGKLQFYDALGNKVKGAALSFYGTVAGDASDPMNVQGNVIGLVTKGVAPGADVVINVAINLGDPENGLLTGCNIGAICPPDVFSIPKGDPGHQSPITNLKVVTSASSYILVSRGDSSDPGYDALP